MTIARRNLVLVVAGCVAVMALAACGGADPVRIIPAAPVDTSTLAGMWKGSVNGTGGYSEVTIFLKADSTILGKPENPYYCQMDGSWTVSDGQFTSTGADCWGTLVSLTAPLARRRLIGTWRAGRGGSGTFQVEKQP
ncbi:MAG: hypothetical protein WKG32_05010 [Gemmatimonadaceae bacterium]